MPSVSIRVLGTFGAALLFAACSSTSTDTPAEDGGTVDRGTGPGTGPVVPVETGPTPAACGRNTTPCDAGGTCDGAADCKSGTCRETKCQDVTPADGVKNGDETDTDCGGTKAPACADGKACSTKDDCVSGVCNGAKICAVPAPNDGVQNGDETGIDCGGSKAPKCSVGSGCKIDGDCNNVKCDPVSKKCADPTHGDGLKNGDETGVDCGGPTAPMRCGTGEGCGAASDCNNVLCTGNTCAAAAHNDGLKNGDETGVDCGGPTAPNRCDAGQGCVADGDCNNIKCDSGATNKCLPASHSDGFKNGDETGVDCGGPTAPTRCATGQGCNALSDCDNVLCTAHLCAAPSNTDGLKNGAETDVDCGGGGPKCAIGKTCGADTDCNVACNYAGKCIEQRSCKAHNGGDTCGPNGNESCCISLSNGGAGANQANIDKYNITAGRFRAMVDDTGGNIRGWITAHKPAWWVDGWTQYLPNTLDSGGTDPDFTGLYQEMGPNVHGTAEGSNEGCSIKGTGARTFRLPDAINTRMGDPQQYSQAVLDPRSLNCVTAYLVDAFCAWDGGYVPNSTQWNLAWGPSTYPWGNAAVGKPAGYEFAYDADINGGGTLSYASYGNGGDGAKYDSPYPTHAVDLKWANFDYNYWGGSTQIANDRSIFIAPPGRFPNGNSPTGHADMAGNVFNSQQLTAVNHGANGTLYSQQWSKSGSWQGHPIPYPVFSGDAQNKYWAKGGRCAH